MLLSACLYLVLAADPGTQRDATREALDRFEELLQAHLDDGSLKAQEVAPLIVVSLQPLYEESRTGYPTQALAALLHVFGGNAIRVCEACTAPRTFVDRDRVEQTMGAVSIDDIVRLDESLRGSAGPARSAVWLDETAQGVSVRIVDLATSRVVMAENIDPRLREATHATETFNLARELDRRARGDSLTHTFIDTALYPGQHVSFDWVDQWGDTNANLSGLTISVWDPLVGVGGAYYRIIPEAWHMSIGAKLLLSIPTALARSAGGDAELFDHLLNVVFAARVPIFQTNYAIFASVSTNGRVGVGISLLNLTFLPVLP